MSQVKIQGNASGTGIFTVASPNSNTDRTLTLPDSTGTVVVSGTTPSLNGIQFPSTQSASADANCLDDYEEGTWSPTLRGSSSHPTVSNTAGGGHYRKIGGLVTVSLNANFTYTGGSGAVYIGGLPFTSKNAANIMSICVGEFGALTTNNTNYTWAGALIGSNENVLTLRQWSRAGNAEIDITYSNIASGGWIRMTMTYMAD